MSSIGLRVLSLADLRQRGISYSRQHLSRLEKAGRWPRRVKVGAGRVGWFEHQIDAYLRERARVSGIVLEDSGAQPGKAA